MFVSVSVCCGGGFTFTESEKPVVTIKSCIQIQLKLMFMFQVSCLSMLKISKFCISVAKSGCGNHMHIMYEAIHTHTFGEKYSYAVSAMCLQNEALNSIKFGILFHSMRLVSDGYVFIFTCICIHY